MQPITNKHFEYYEKVLDKCNGDKCAAYAALQLEFSEVKPPTEEEITDYYFLETCVDIAANSVIHEYMTSKGYSLKLKEHIYKKEVIV